MSRPYDYDDGSGKPAASAPLSQHGIVGFLRWFWRQLTSMRVALLLLLMLALATIPGSLVPQRSADPNGVIQFETDHPKLFPILDAFPIQAFDVYSSVWFSAIYLLLFVSLIGCILPRVKHHWIALRSKPPKTPALLKRMAGFSEVLITNENASDAEKLEYAERAVAEGQKVLKRSRYRTKIETTTRRGATEVSVTAERGHLRETGNLIFHIALVGVLVSVGVGSGQTFNGQKALIEGEAMVNALIDYDTVNTGQFFDDTSLMPFGMRLDSLEVDYYSPEDNNVNALGQVKEYRANVTMLEPDGSENEGLIRVNDPLREHGSPIYLIANGYAPTLTVKNPDGETVFQESVPFIPQDTNMVSLGVVKIPHGLGEQVGLRGFFYPTKADLETGAYTSNYPDLENPLLTLDVFTGDLGINDGVPQSVYALDTGEMDQLTGRAVDEPSIELTPGDTAELPNGMGTISLDEIPRYASFDVMRNPAQVWVLISALAALGGLMLSLFIPRRRMWIKAIPVSNGVKLQYAALARGDDPAIERAVEDLRDSHKERL
ncbi:MAG: cytochrome c biogenesis protein ResB [Canibacter sp.]